jgi:hypothetical protein
MLGKHLPVVLGVEPFGSVFRHNDRSRYAGLVEINGQGAHNVSQAAVFGCRVTFHTNVEDFHGLSFAFFG